MGDRGPGVAFGSLGLAALHPRLIKSAASPLVLKQRNKGTEVTLLYKEKALGHSILIMRFRPKSILDRHRIEAAEAAANQLDRQKRSRYAGPLERLHHWHTLGS